MIGKCPSSIVWRQHLFFLKPTPSTPLGQLNQNLIGSIGLTCRSKIATTVDSNCYVEHFVVKRIINQYKNIKIGCSFIVGAFCIGRRGFHVTSTCHASVNIGGVSNKPQW